MGGVTAAFSSAMPAKLLWVRADLAVLRLPEPAPFFPGDGPGFTTGPCMKQFCLPLPQQAGPIKEKAKEDASPGSAPTSRMKGVQQELSRSFQW